LEDWGVKPQQMIGHRLGEYVAACLSGVFSLEDAITLVVLRERNHLSRINMQVPQIPFISNRTGDWITAKQAVDPDYWVNHLRGTVRFAKGVETLLKESETVFLEVGPGRSLGEMVSAGNPRKQSTVIYTCGDQKATASDQETLLKAIGDLWISGITPDWNAFHNREKRRRISLPTYPFDRKRYWIDAGTPVETTENDRKTNQTRISKNEPTQWFYLPEWKRSFPLNRLIVDRNKPSTKRHRRGISLTGQCNAPGCI
jgi:acyl transferase domain-containing protein